MQIITEQIFYLIPDLTEYVLSFILWLQHSYTLCLSVSKSATVLKGCVPELNSWEQELRSNEMC